MFLTDSRIELDGLWTCTDENGHTCKFKIDGHRSYTQHGRGGVFSGCERDTAIMSLLCWAAHFWNDNAVVKKQGTDLEATEVTVKLER